MLGHHWVSKVSMATINLTNTAGIAMATYGSSPSDKGGVQNKLIGEIGNILMLVALVLIVAWLWPTLLRIRSNVHHPNASSARWLLWGAVAALPFQIIRTIYNATYAFTLTSSLDPFFGSFATKVVLLFLMEMLAAIALVGGGWMSKGVIRVDEVELLNGLHNSDSGAEELRKK